MVKIFFAKVHFLYLYLNIKCIMGTAATISVLAIFGENHYLEVAATIAGVFILAAIAVYLVNLVRRRIRQKKNRK